MFYSMIIPSLLLLTTASPTFFEPTVSAPTLEIALSSTITTDIHENIEPIFHSLFDPAIYFGAGAFFGSATLLSGVSWVICQLSPWASTTGNECLISSQIFGIASIHSFAQGFKTSPLLSFFFKKMPSSHSAWDLNKKLLSEISASSLEDKELLSFLEKRWLAKTTGCYPFQVNWMCPSFGISFQVHPESTNSYARDPATKYSDTYMNRVEAWKRFLPHPKEFPLILTRPVNVREHLPQCFEIPYNEKIQHSVERMAHAISTPSSPIIVDLTAVLPSDTLDRKRWLDVWLAFQNQFSKLCIEHELDLDQVLCIQRVQQRDISGIRLLPLLSISKENIEKQYQFLLEWISRFGLTANRIELDRPLFPSEISPSKQHSIWHTSMEFESQEQWISFLDSIDHLWKSHHPQKTFMVKGTLQILKALIIILPQEKWEEVMNSPTRSSIVQLFFKKIKEQLHLLIQEDEKASFHETISHIEQIHADFTPLLEIFMPFTSEDFPEIYRKHLTTIPEQLLPLTRYAIHSSGMTSLGAIFQTVEKSLGRPARILYGDNTYFEIINLSERVAKASTIKEAKAEDWQDVDLLLMQFNPTVKRINFKVTEYQATEYHVERIADILHHALKDRKGKPLSLALDCTLEFSDSARVGELLSKFQNEIENGDLNIMCYRSGLKFDLFGMDNYCGAPFFMVNNREAKWSFFDSLLTDSALQTDRLSLNWFCLVYQHVTPYLEGYRKQIFDNTRTVLNKIPKRLFNRNNPYYRVIPIDSDVDPSFIDIKIFGPLHAFRGDLLVGVYLTIKCMEAGYPLLYRPGIGFFHPNLAVLFGKECTTVRLTVGFDPAQVDVIVRCLEKIDACNGPCLLQNP
jgi:hypothetical protein